MPSGQDRRDRPHSVVGPPPPVLSSAQREHLRHPLERRIAALVALVDSLLVGLVVVLLLWGAEWLTVPKALASYAGHARILLVAVLAAPIVATWLRRRRWILTQDDSIRVDTTQLPRLHGILVSYCRRVGMPLRELYISDALDRSTSFAWRRHQCIILSTEELAHFPGAFNEMFEFLLAREVGSICLGHTSFRNELLKSFVAPVRFSERRWSRFAPTRATAMARISPPAR